MAKSARCSHKRIAIIESGTWETSHDRDTEEPVSWFHNHEPSSYHDMVDVICAECGLSRRYSKRRAPKWLRRFLDEIGI